MILVIALIVLGPKRLPEVARSLGKAMAEFRRQSSEVMEELQAQARLDGGREPSRRPPPRPRRGPTPAAVRAATSPGGADRNARRPGA